MFGSRDKRSAASLQREAEELFEEQNTGTGEPHDRLERASHLRARISQARTSTQDADVASVLDDADRMAEFVELANQPPSAEDPLGREVRALDEEVLRLALRVAGGDHAARDTEAAELAHRRDELLRRAREQGRLDEIADALHDASLDIVYARSGGRAPSSIRLAHRLRDDGTS